MKICQQIADELAEYKNGEIEISEGARHSEYRLKKRIFLYYNQTYAETSYLENKVDEDGNYLYWYDIISPRVDSEVKNIDFDSKNIEISSERSKDMFLVGVSNLRLKEYLRTSGEGEELNSAIEEGSALGNVVFKKVKGGKERVDLRNFYVLNQGAETLDQSDVIERHVFTQAQLRAKKGTWENVDDVIKYCGDTNVSETQESQPSDVKSLKYVIYERNGFVSLAALKEAQGKEFTTEDEETYVLAKVIIPEKQKGEKYVLFAEELKGKKMSDVYKEFHRGRYRGKWWREGLVEVLMDPQTRANEIGNQIARGLEWASKQFFSSPDRLVYQNVLSDMRSGDIIQAKELRQVDVRMQAFDQLIADWNRNIQLANELANSREVVQGENMPSGTPFRTTGLLNQNANKLFDFIREKLGLVLTDVFEEWIVPEMLKELKAEDVVRLTGEPDSLKRLYNVVAECYYLKATVRLPAHGDDVRDAIIAKYVEELSSRPQVVVTGLKYALADFIPNVSVVITGENTNKDKRMASYSTFIQFEADLVRRSALVEEAMKLDGIDVAKLPKTPPAPPPQQMPQGQPMMRQPVNA